MLSSIKYPRISLKRVGILPAIFLLGFVVFNPFGAVSLHAQEPQKPFVPGPSVRLSPLQWKAVEGYFRNPRNGELYIQFTAKDTVLLAKMLWNSNEIRLTPESAFSFYSNQAGDEGPVRIIFSKDSSGVLNQFSRGNNDIWKRAWNYKQIVRTEIKHTPDQLMKFEGLYQFKEDKKGFIQFTVKENFLVLKQHWDGEMVKFIPESELDFFSKESPLFSLSFVKDKDGAIIQAIAFKHDVWEKLQPAHLTQDQLRIFEGKYQFKDDPDNFIQVAALQNKLQVKQLWDHRTIDLTPQTETYFYNAEQSYPCLFQKDKDGKITQMVVLGLDTFVRVND